MKNIYEKLFNIQQELKAPKGQYNEFGKYKYRSCEDIFEAVKPLLKKYKCILLTDDELVSIGERYYIKATAKLIDAENPYEEFEGECREENYITNVGYAREEENKKNFDGSQITGASSSYARKYALNGMFLIDDNKDSDTTNVGEEITLEQANNYRFTFGKYKGSSIDDVYDIDKKYLQWCLDNGKNEDVKKMITLVTGYLPTPIPSEEEQQERFELMTDMSGLVEVTNTDYEKLLEHYKVKSNSEMTTEQLRDAVEKLKEKL